MTAVYRIFTSLLLGVTIGCASGPLMKEPLDLKPYTDGSGSLIVKNQSRLVIPRGWQFTRPNEKPVNTNLIESSVFFMFDDRQKNVYGRFEYTILKKLEGSINGLALVTLHAKTVLTHITDKTIHRTDIGDREAYIIAGRHARKKWDYMAVLIPEANAFNEIQLFADRGYFAKHPETAYRIFNSYRYAPKLQNERSMGNGIAFKCLDGRWMWQEDWVSGDLEGFIFTDTPAFETPIEYIGVARIASNRMQVVQDLIAGYQEVVIVPHYDAAIAVGGRQFAAKAVVSKNRKDLISVYYLFPANTGHYLVMICYKEGASAIRAEGIHRGWGLVAQTLNSYLYW